MLRSIVFALALVLASTSNAAVAATHYRVCLDPGHGGSDPGAVRGTLVEKEITLDIAQRIRAALESTSQYTVHLTRDDNATALGNSDRAAICNTFGAQAVLSIHLNASTDPTVDYAWIFYGKRNKDLAFARTIDARYLIPDPYGTDPLPHKRVTNFANGTLLKSSAPAALAETVFLSNTKEQELLAAADGARRQQIADALVSGIRAFAGR